MMMINRNRRTTTRWAGLLLSGLLLLSAGCQKQAVNPDTPVVPINPSGEPIHYTLGVGVSSGSLRAVGTDGMTVYEATSEVAARDKVATGISEEDLVFDLIVLAYQNNAVVADFDYSYDAANGVLTTWGYPKTGAVDLYIYANVGTDKASLFGTDIKPVGGNPILQKAWSYNKSQATSRSTFMQPIGSAVKSIDGKYFVTPTPTTSLNSGNDLIPTCIPIDAEKRIGLPMFTLIKGVQPSATDRSKLEYTSQYTIDDSATGLKTLEKVVLERAVAKLTVNVTYSEEPAAGSNLGKMTGYYFSSIALGNVPDYIAVRPDLMRLYSENAYNRTELDPSDGMTQVKKEVSVPLYALRPGEAGLSYYPQNPVRTIPEAKNNIWFSDSDIDAVLVATDPAAVQLKDRTFTFYIPEVIATDPSEALQLVYSVAELPTGDKANLPTQVIDGVTYYPPLKQRVLKSNIGYKLKTGETQTGPIGSLQIHRNYHYTINLRLKHVDLSAWLEVLVSPFKDDPEGDRVEVIQVL